MNLLVHYLLSDREEEVIVGNIIADFIRVNEIALFSEGIKKGIELHKQIDRFSDNHPVVKETWLLLQKDFGLYGRVITDIYYDHFLYVHWAKFSSYSFEDDLAFFYFCLNKHLKTFQPKLRRMMTKIVAMQWPVKYTNMSGLYQVFRSMSKRVVFDNKFEKAVEVLEQNYQTIEQQFLKFFPDLREYVNSLKSI